MKVIDALNANIVMQKFVAATSLPISISYKLLPVVEAVADIAAMYEERRVARIKEIGEHDEGSDTYQVSKDQMPAFQKLMESYTEEEVELPDIQIDIKDLEGKIELSIADIKQIRWLLKP